jgi:uncharacterized protein (DUF1697 family)
VSSDAEAPESPRFAAFVRNIMVGRNGLTAGVLRQIVIDVGGHEPRSHLATGNLTFSSPALAVESIGRAIERSIESVLGRREDVFIRSLAWLTASVEAAPFGGMTADDVYERCVTFLPAGSPVSLTLPVETPRRDTVLFARNADDVLSITRLVGGRPGQPGKYVESEAGIRVTTRNLNTIERIVRLEG